MFKKIEELYKKHIDTLRKIASENPDLIKKCGTPPLLTASIDGWIGICDENTMNETVLFLDGNGSYNVSRVYAIDAAIKKFLLAHPELGNQVKGFEELKTVLRDAVKSEDMRYNMAKAALETAKQDFSNELTGKKIRKEMELIVYEN